MDRDEQITSLKSDLETLKAEEKRLLGLIGLGSPPEDLKNRLQAISAMLRVVSDKLFDLERGQDH